MISAKDDEPEFVRAYTRKVLRLLLLVIVVAVSLDVVSAILSPSPPLPGILFLVQFVPLIGLGWWVHRNYPPVRKWREDWLKAHQVRLPSEVNKEESK